MEGAELKPDITTKEILLGFALILVSTIFIIWLVFKGIPDQSPRHDTCPQFIGCTIE